MPTFNSDPRWLGEAIDSVLSQVYPSWELRIVDDGSTDPGLRGVIEGYARRDRRVKAAFLKRNSGISVATNRALEACEGELVAFLDHDDVLDPGALARVVGEFARHPQADALYSDEDKLSVDGRRVDPFLKPDYSPVYALGAMYIGHLLTIRRSLAEEVGGMDPAYDKIQDFEFLLRLSERTEQIHHVPEILYHWRAAPGSIAAGEDSKSGVGELQAAAVSAHLARRGIPARAAPHRSIPHRARVVADPTADLRPVSIVVAASGRDEHLQRCLRSMIDHTDPDRVELIVVVDPDHGRLPAPDRVQRVEREPGSLHRSRANNLGAERAGGKLLLFASDAIEVFDPDWIDHLALFAGIPGVGPVGPLLARPDDTVEQAGLVVGLEDPVSPAHQGDPVEGDGYYGTLSCAREVSALSAECMLVDRSLFRELGGFREEYRSQFEDFDLCQRALQRRLRPVFAPGVRVISHETPASRRSSFDVVDRALYVDCWYEQLRAGDPFYNPNFKRKGASYEPLCNGGPG